MAHDDTFRLGLEGWIDDRHVGRMDQTDLMMAVFWGNCLTLSLLWGWAQFARYDYKAPWLAYAAVLVPALIAIGYQISTGELPPQFDALTPQRVGG